MKGIFMLAALLAAGLVIGTTSCSKEADAEPGKQMTCPVMKGENINPDLYADANGKRIYVCCPGCIVKIKADPGKYIQQMEAEGIVLEKTPEEDHSGHTH